MFQGKSKLALIGLLLAVALVGAACAPATEGAVKQCLDKGWVPTTSKDGAVTCNPPAAQTTTGNANTAQTTGNANTAQTTGNANTAQTTGRNQPNGQGQYKQSTMDKFNYTWSYVPALPSVTTGPKLRDDAQSSGKGVWVTHDIGVPPGTFAIVKGVTIEVGVITLGTPCALAGLSPGYYRNVRGLEWRFEIYYLPNSNPLDPTGWSKVLADQAQVTEHTLYQCPTKSLAEIPVFFSDEPTPFGP